MSSKKFWFIAAVCILLFSTARAASLDELYRDIIRSDNRGYLPLFVKNRKVPDSLFNAEGLDLPKKSATNETQKPVNLSNDLQQRMASTKESQDQWERTLAAVKSNQVTPLELNDISTRVDKNDPVATEVLAWMYTTGVGVAPDFIEAFNLYRKAARLNVANAEQNALIVYKAMNEEQRRQLRNRL